MNEKVYILNAYGKDHKIILGKTSYRNNNTIAVLMIEVFDDGHEEDWATLTVNLECNLGLANADDSQFIDTNNLGKDIIKWLEDNKIATFTGLSWPSGFCVYPLVFFNKDALASMRKFQYGTLSFNSHLVLC